MESSTVISMGLALTKYLGIFLSAASGVLGLLVEFKEEYVDDQGTKRKRVSRWGKLALAGILIGAFLSTASEFLSTLKSRVSAAQELARVNRLLNEINRSINLIQNPTLSWEFELPLDDPSLSSFRAAIEKSVSEIQNTPDGRNECGGYYRYDSPSHPSTVRFWKGCGVIPGLDGSGLGNLLNTFGLALRLSKPIPGEAISETPVGSADMSFHVSAGKTIQQLSASAGFEVGQPNYHFEYELGEKKLMLCGDNAAPENWLSNGKILAVPDIAGAQMWVSQTYIVFPKQDDTEKQLYDRLRAKLILRGITLRFDKQLFRLPGNRFLVQKDEKGEPRFYARFPDSLEELRVGVKK